MNDLHIHTNIQPRSIIFILTDLLQNLFIVTTNPVKELKCLETGGFRNASRNRGGDMGWA